jgi:hypothetical protein
MLAVVSLLVGHELVYALRYGVGAALARAMTARGHDGYWPLFLVVAGTALVLLLVAAAVRHQRFRSRLRSVRLRSSVWTRVATAGAPTLRAEWRALLDHRATRIAASPAANWRPCH